MTHPLLIEVTDGVAVLTLNRPERRNAYDDEMGRLLSQAYRDCDADDSVRVIVLTGAGDAFCAGADFASESSPFDAPTQPAAFTASPIDPPAFELRKPVIAAVNGHAIGIGMTIALQADIRVMAERAKYGIVQVRRWVIPDCMAHWTLTKLAGVAVAADLLITGRTFDGAEAVALGIATRVLPGAEVLDHALAVARDIAVNVAPMSAALCKRLLWAGVDNGYTARETAHLETLLHHRVMGSPDAAEGVAAFVDRRPPRWTASVSGDWKPLPDPRT